MCTGRTRSSSSSASSLSLFTKPPVPRLADISSIPFVLFDVRYPSSLPEPDSPLFVNTRDPGLLWTLHFPTNLFSNHHVQPSRWPLWGHPVFFRRNSQFLFIYSNDCVHTSSSGYSPRKNPCVRRHARFVRKCAIQRCQGRGRRRDSRRRRRSGDTSSGVGFWVWVEIYSRYLSIPCALLVPHSILTYPSFVPLFAHVLQSRRMVRCARFRA